MLAHVRRVYRPIVAPEPDRTLTAALGGRNISTGGAGRQLKAMPSFWPGARRVTSEHPRHCARSTLRRSTPAALIALTAFIVAACGSSVLESTPTPTPTSAPPATSTPTATPTPDPADVRSIDFTDPAVVGPLIDRFGGGHIEHERITYTDMTGDGVDEAVVIVESGGTMGDLGVAIFGVEGGQVRMIQLIEGGGRIEVLFADVGFGVLRLLEAAPEPGDPLCCPSKLRETVYEWDGDEFAAVTEQLIDNPDL